MQWCMKFHVILHSVIMALTALGFRTYMYQIKFKLIFHFQNNALVCSKKCHYSELIHVLFGHDHDIEGWEQDCSDSIALSNWNMPLDIKYYPYKGLVRNISFGTLLLYIKHPLHICIQMFLKRFCVSSVWFPYDVQYMVRHCLWCSCDHYFCKHQKLNSIIPLRILIISSPKSLLIKMIKQAMAHIFEFLHKCCWWQMFFMFKFSF